MVCCTIIAALLALLIKPLAMLRADPLAWRLSAPGQAATSPTGRAASRIASVTHAIDGWRFLVRNEPNLRIHLMAAAVVLVAGFKFEVSAADWRWLILAVIAVLVAEALNTAVEQACNAVSREFHPAIKAAKDVAAGGVLFAALGAVLIGASVFAPHLRGGEAANVTPFAMTICGGAT